MTGIWTRRSLAPKTASLPFSISGTVTRPTRMNNGSERDDRVRTRILGFIFMHNYSVWI